jgi:hypothetical protein
LSGKDRIEERREEKKKPKKERKESEQRDRREKERGEKGARDSYVILFSPLPLRTSSVCLLPPTDSTTS